MVVSDRVCVQCVGLGLVICPSVVSLTSALCFLPRSAADPRRRIELLEAVLCTCIYLFMLRVYGRLAVMCPPGEIVNWQTDRIVFIPHRLIIFNQMCWVCFASSFLHEGICCLIIYFFCTFICIYPDNNHQILPKVTCSQFQVLIQNEPLSAKSNVQKSRKINCSSSSVICTTCRS